MNNPELYAKYVTRIGGAVTKNILRKYLKNVKFQKENVSVLDIGTGDGYPTVEVLLPQIPKKCKELIGIDIREEMIDYSSKLYQRPDVKFVKMDITEENVPAEFNQRFDHAFSFYCLHFVPNKRAFYQNIFKMLTPEGDYLGTQITKSPIFTNFITMSKYPGYNQLYPKELVRLFENFDSEQKSTQEVLKDTGFASYFCEHEAKALACKTCAEFRQFVSSVDPILPKLFTNERKQYLDDFMKEIRKLDDITFVPEENGDGMVIANVQLLVVYASKT